MCLYLCIILYYILCNYVLYINIHKHICMWLRQNFSLQPMLASHSYQLFCLKPIFFQNNKNYILFTIQIYFYFKNLYIYMYIYSCLGCDILFLCIQFQLHTFNGYIHTCTQYIELYCSLCMLSQNPDSKHAVNMPQNIRIMLYVMNLNIVFSIKRSNTFYWNISTEFSFKFKFL